MTSRRLLGFGSAGLLLVDAPVLLVALVASVRFGFWDTLSAVIQFRQAHPSTYVVAPVIFLLGMVWGSRS